MIPCNLCWLSTGRTLIVPTFLPPENSSKNKAHQFTIFDGVVRSAFAMKTGTLSPAYPPEWPEFGYRAELYQKQLNESLNYCRNRYCKTISQHSEGAKAPTQGHHWTLLVVILFNSLNSSIEDCDTFPFLAVSYPNQNSRIIES